MSIPANDSTYDSRCCRSWDDEHSISNNNSDVDVSEKKRDWWLVYGKAQVVVLVV